MSTQRDEVFAAALAEIRAKYALELPQEVDRLTIAIEHARAGEASGPGSAQTIAHQLHGTAGCYGFTEISEAARTLEVAFQTLKGSAAGSTEVWAEIEHALTRMKKALAQVQSDNPRARPP